MPSASVFDDFGRVAMGRLGQWLVYLTVYLTVFTEPIVFHLTRCGYKACFALLSVQPQWFRQGFLNSMLSFCI